jgi:hypothetical protein
VSLLAVTSELPSGVKARALTVASWPVRVATSCNRPTSQSFTVQSPPLVASLWPSGENSTPTMVGGMDPA